MKRYLPFLIILLAAASAFGGFVYMRNKAVEPGAGVVNPTTSNGTRQAPTQTASVAPTPVSVMANEPGASPPHALGPADAPVTLEEFGDFQCPPCGLLHPELKKIANRYGSKVRIIYRQFPLTANHPHALPAAKASEAAGLQGKFWEMHGMIFDNQRTWHSAGDARPTFEEYAKAIGLDMERYRRDVASSAVEQRIFLDGKRAHVLNVKGTPTLFLNGREVPFESLPAERLAPLIDAALARAGR